MHTIKEDLKTWIEIDTVALQNNYERLRSLLLPQTLLWAVVKANAYGHGIIALSTILDRFGVQGFCVDSVIEGIKLRESGITKPILVMGPTLPPLFRRARSYNLVITLPSIAALRIALTQVVIPSFHIKVDTGMHRQGIMPAQLSMAFQLIRKNNLPLRGMYTHFAEGNDLSKQQSVEQQFQSFQRAKRLAFRYDLHNLCFHAAATGVLFMDPRYQCDAVRIGKGLYGLWPSESTRRRFSKTIPLAPILSWHSLISDITTFSKGSSLGYGHLVKLRKKTTVALIPVGFWHGYDRGLIHRGLVGINGQRANVIGAVSMNIIMIDVTGIACKLGDPVTLLGTTHGAPSARQLATCIQTIQTEITTRINPLIKRIYV